MSRVPWLGRLIALVAVGLAACAPTAPAGPSTTAPTPGSAAAPATPAAPAEISFTDATGARLTFTRRVERVVCLAGPCQDMLFELGLMPVAARGIAKERKYLLDLFDQYDKVPPIAGSFAEPNLEDIAKAQPDLVIGIGGQVALREALRPFAPLWIVGPRSYRDAFENLRLLGRITGREAQAEAAIRKTENKIADYRARATRNERPIVLKMWGTGQLFGIDPIESVYGSVLAEVTNYPWRTPPNTPDAGGGDGRIAYSLEEILRVNPDVLVIADFDAAFGGPPFTNQFKDNPIWAQITAVKTERILMGNVTTYLNTRGTRAFRLMLDEVMPFVYPTIFPQPLPDRER
jgi:iron complex transport system substrate-binding protein